MSQKSVIVLIVALINCHSVCYSQEGLKIGETIPDLHVSNVLFYSKGQIDLLNEFKGKVILLDFFGTYCGPCIAALPHLDSLQNIYRDKLQVLLIDHESPTVIENFFKRNSIGKSVNFPVIAEDSILGGNNGGALFKFNSIPTEVLLNINGKVTAIATADEITNDNIRDFLSGKEVGFQVKRYTKYTDNLMTTLQKVEKEQLIHYSFLGRYTPGLPSSIGTPVFNSVLNTEEMLDLNCPILDLFKIAYLRDSGMIFPDCKVIKPGADSLYRINTSTGRNIYCYELRQRVFYDSTMPTIENKMRSMIAAYKVMQDDLANATGLTGEVKKEKIKCFLIRDNLHQRPQLSDSGQVQAFYQTGKNDITLHFRNFSVSDIVFTLAYQVGAPVFLIDGTNCKSRVNLDVDLDSLGDVKKLNDQLSLQGFNVVESESESNVLVLTSTNR